MPRALHIAAFDSQLKWCGRLRDELEARGFGTEVVVPQVRSALSPGQIADAGFTEVEPVGWAELVERMLSVDVVVCSLSGPFTRALIFDLRARLREVEGPGPVVVTGWVGVIIEKITAGYLDRCGSDVVAVNCVSDLAHFRQAAGALDLPTDNLLLAGLPILSGEPTPPRTGIKRLLFADQPTVPGSAAERRFLYEGAVAYARAHPDREVLLKPRHRPEEDTFHTMRFHPAMLLDGVELPPNFRIDYTAVAEVLPTVDLLVTMSSTACLEALDAGVQVALVLDLGVHERYGNHVFLESGLLRTWAQIEADDIGTAEPAWRDSYFFPRTRTATQAVVDRVETLLATGERPSAGVWSSAYFDSAASYHHAHGSAALLRARRVKRQPRRPARIAREVLPPAVFRRLRTVVRRSRRAVMPRLAALTSRWHEPGGTASTPTDAPR